MIKWYDASKTGKSVASAHILSGGKLREVEVAYLNGTVYCKPLNRREFVGPTERTIFVRESGDFTIVCVGPGGKCVTVGNGDNCAGGGSGSCSVSNVTIAGSDAVNVKIDGSRSLVTVGGVPVCSANAGKDATASQTGVSVGTGGDMGYGVWRYGGNSGTKGDTKEGEIWCQGGDYANPAYHYGVGQGAAWHEGGYVWEYRPESLSDEMQGYVLIERM